MGVKKRSEEIASERRGKWKEEDRRLRERGRRRG